MECNGNEERCVLMQIDYSTKKRKNGKIRSKRHNNDVYSRKDKR